MLNIPTLCAAYFRTTASQQPSGVTYSPGRTPYIRRCLKGGAAAPGASVVCDGGAAVVLASRFGLCLVLPATPACLAASPSSASSGLQEAGRRSSVPAPKSRHLRDQHLFVAVLSRGHGHGFSADNLRPALGLCAASKTTMSSAAMSNPARAAIGSNNSRGQRILCDLPMLAMAMRALEIPMPPLQTGTIDVIANCVGHTSRWSGFF